MYIHIHIVSYIHRYFHVQIWPLRNTESSFESFQMGFAFSSFVVSPGVAWNHKSFWWDAPISKKFYNGIVAFNVFKCSLECFFFQILIFFFLILNDLLIIFRNLSKVQLTSGWWCGPSARFLISSRSALVVFYFSFLLPFCADSLIILQVYTTMFLKWKKWLLICRGRVKDDLQF